MPWFAPTLVEDPVAGAGHPWLHRRGCRWAKSMEMDPETMKLALRITFGRMRTKLAELFRKVKRPRYAAFEGQGVGCSKGRHSWWSRRKPGHSVDCLLAPASRPPAPLQRNAFAFSRDRRNCTFANPAPRITYAASPAPSASPPPRLHSGSWQFKGSLRLSSSLCHAAHPRSGLFPHRQSH